MNRSGRTRKEQVLDRLVEAAGGWVDGSELATVEVGGSEGLKRLRELRDEGYNIEGRHHPDPNRDIWQYRLATGPWPGPISAPAVRGFYPCPKCNVPLVDIHTLDASGKWATGRCWSCGQKRTVRRTEV